MKMRLLSCTDETCDNEQRQNANGGRKSLMPISNYRFPRPCRHQFAQTGSSLLPDNVQFCVNI